MLTNSAEQMKVNVFMTFDELPEYIMVMLDRKEFIVKVQYYRANNDEITDIDLDKFEVIKSFTHANLEEAELKYSELNDVRVAVPMISGYLKNLSK
ncbi:trypsin [Solibacillus sp. R5-41]|uniref:trypsin n=1 Tax=Solibacillus sp. R5-41 TaxID=2048654 RepID=UPI000C126D1C|nr:trypsin [Solibacillus sp. R5-41]ATP39947.1 trypsin [Solibacillus sp. R5-41]